MTIKAFLQDAYTHIFQAKIMELTTYQGKNAIVLDATYFYPEGGGQPTDMGTIENCFICDVQIHENVIYHLTDDSIEGLQMNQSVECVMDFNRRFALMQQHSGQHILSACFQNLLDINTIGFHIGDNYITIDLDRKISNDELLRVEQLANQVVFEDVEIRALYPTNEELCQMKLRKAPKYTENIRVIEVLGYDFSPCGGTHVRRTGEIGLIKIKRTEPYKNGVRIEFGCGSFALDFINKRNDTINQLMKLFSVKDHEILDFATQLIDTLKEEKNQIQKMKELLYRSEVEKLMTFDSDDIAEDIKVITLNEMDLSMVDLRLKVSMICEYPQVIVIGSSQDNDKTHFVLAKSKDLTSDFDMSVLFKTYLSPLEINGGGNAFVAQGGTTKAIDIVGIFETIQNELQKIIEA